MSSTIEVVHTPFRKARKGTKLPRRGPIAPKARKVPAKKKKGPSISKLKKEADAIFSKFIRARDNGQCYTCPNKNDPKKMQNGHFVPRQYLATRYDEVNNHCQCYACNMLYNGQPSVYALNLERDYGIGTVEMLEGKRKTLIKDFDYKWVIETYTEKYQSLLENPVKRPSPPV